MDAQRFLNLITNALASAGSPDHSLLARASFSGKKPLFLAINQRKLWRIAADIRLDVWPASCPSGGFLPAMTRSAFLHW